MDTDALIDLGEHISSEMEQVVLDATISNGELTISAHAEHVHQFDELVHEPQHAGHQDQHRQNGGDDQHGAVTVRSLGVRRCLRFRCH